MRHLFSFHASKPAPPPPLHPPPPTAAELSQHPTLLNLLASRASPALTPSESALLTTPATLTRYLRARSHDPHAAAAMLHATLLFRRALPPPQPCPACVADPAAHSFYPIGPASTATAAGAGAAAPLLRDVTPVMYSNFLVRDRHPPTVATHMLSAMDATFDADSLQRMVWVMDFRGFSRADVSPASARRVLGMFADHFPERLGCAVVYDAPRAFAALWAAVRVFAAAETVAKVVFVGPGEGREELERVGIRAETCERVLQEVRLAREGVEVGSWWGRKPLPPLVDYGSAILGERERQLQSNTNDEGGDRIGSMDK